MDLGWEVTTLFWWILFRDVITLKAYASICNDEELPHHEEGCASQQRFQSDLKDLTDILLSRSNPFQDDNKVCIATSTAASVRIFESTRQQQLIREFKQHAELFGQSFVALDSRGGNLEDFFRHESSPYLLALSYIGVLNSCTKSDLLL